MKDYEINIIYSQYIIYTTVNFHEITWIHAIDNKTGSSKTLFSCRRIENPIADSSHS